MPTRVEWQQLAEERILDAKALYTVGRWSGAFYLLGYAVECGLKACVLVRVGSHPEIVYEDRRFSNEAWTHDLERLLLLADLKTVRDSDAEASTAFYQNWQRMKDWSEESRYEQHDQQKADNLMAAVTDPNSGVLQWIRLRW